MGIINSKTGEEKRYSVEELIEVAGEMRAFNLISIHAAKSGHPGGTLSIMDVVAALYLNEVRIDPNNLKWEKRDRIFFSAGHKAPAIYAALAKVGIYTDEDIVTLRKLNSPFQGHPHAPKLPGIEVSSGSLGQGLSIATGCALAAKLDKKNYRAYCVMGDGEQQEGNIWEAVMMAGNNRLDNLCGIVDRNKLQIDGWTREVMGLEPLVDKYRAFNWYVIEIDGHDMKQILAAFQEARNTKDKPSVIIANTIKGNGVSFMENEVGWHGVATKTDEQLNKALKDIQCNKMTNNRVKHLLHVAKKYHRMQKDKLYEKLPKFQHNYWWNEGEDMQVEMDPTRFGFGRSLKAIGNDPRIVTIHADISNSIRISEFEKDYPDRKNRVFSVGIAEQNMMGVAAGLSLEGKIPVTGTYGVFAAGRSWDQIRTTVCYDNLNVKIAGAHSGISVGADGATHQALEEIALMSILPNMNVLVPCDSMETERLTKIAILDVKGPTYIRFAREATPVVTELQTPLIYGKANVIRYQSRCPRFRNAFKIFLAEEYKNESEDLSFIACGLMVPEAMRAALILKEEFGIEARVLNIHTVKPIDQKAIMLAVEETGVIITCEEHQIGGFGNIVAGVINRSKAYRTPLLFDMAGINDRFGESGEPWELMIQFGLTAEYLVQKARNLLDNKR